MFRKMLNIFVMQKCSDGAGRTFFWTFFLSWNEIANTQKIAGWYKVYIRGISEPNEKQTKRAVRIGLRVYVCWRILILRHTSKRPAPAIFCWRTPENTYTHWIRRGANDYPRHPLVSWEFQFSVLISGPPIGSGIPIPFLIPKIPVEFFSFFRCIEKSRNRNSGSEVRNSEKNGRRNSIHLISCKASIIIGQPVDLTMLNRMDVGTMTGKAIFLPILHLLNMRRRDFCGLNDHATKLTSRVLKMSRCDFCGMIILPTKITSTQVE